MTVEFSDSIDARLERWAIWKMRNDDACIGFPTRTSFAKYIITQRKEEPLFSFTELEKDSEVIDHALLKLELEQRHIIKIFYCSPGTAKSKADGMGVSRRTFYRRLDSSVRKVEHIVNSESDRQRGTDMF